MKILNCTENLNRAPELREAPPWTNRQHMTQVQKKLPRKKETDPTLCNQATHSFPFRGSFTNRASVGKRFSMRTRRVFPIRRNSRLGKRLLFLRSLSLGTHSSRRLKLTLLYSKQLALPGNQQRGCSCALCCDRLQRAARRDKGRLQAELLS